MVAKIKNSSDQRIPQEVRGEPRRARRFMAVFNNQIAHGATIALARKRARGATITPEERARERFAPPRIQRHYGPGPHPGTGTEQDVHAGDRGGGEWLRISKKKAVDLLTKKLEKISEDVYTLDNIEWDIWARGWLAPDGRFFSLRQSHFTSAEYVVDGVEGVDPVETWYGVKKATRSLKNLGFIRMIISSSQINFEGSRSLTFPQARMLGKMLAQDYGRGKRIVHMDVMEMGREQLGLMYDNYGYGHRNFLETLIDEAYRLEGRSYYAERHYGPGPHPGTGTEQDVHAGTRAKHIVYRPEGMGAREWSRFVREDLEGFRYLEMGTRKQLVITDMDVALQRIADKTRNRPREQFALLDDDGVVFDKQGEETSVTFSRWDVNQMLKSADENPERFVSIHNHPEYHEGVATPPSWEDFKFAMITGQTEFRVATSRGDWIVRSTPGRFVESDAQEILRHWNDFADKNIAEYVPDWKSVGSGSGGGDEWNRRWESDREFAEAVTRLQVDRLLWFNEVLSHLLTVEFVPLDAEE